jgi:hypothetical protein
VVHNRFRLPRSRFSVALCWSLAAAVFPVYAEGTGNIALNAGSALIAAAALLCAVGLYAAIRSVIAAATEHVRIKAEVHAIVSGDFMPLEKKERIFRIKKRGFGLRFKITAFTIALSLPVVAMVLAPLYYMMIRTRRETLLRGLWDRSAVLLEGLASNAQACLPPENVEDLARLPGQAAAIPEAYYVTITGGAAGSSVFGDYVWATNDPNILLKIDTPEFYPGLSRLTDALSPRLAAIGRELDGEARTQGEHLVRMIAELSLEAESLALRSDTESLRRLNNMGTTLRILERTLDRTLAGISREMLSEPAFSTGSIPKEGNNRCLFFKPVMYHRNGEDIFFRGLVRMEISTESISREITGYQIRLLRIILIVALAALAIGVAGALTLSTLIIRPIRKLARYVEIIRDTGNKVKLDSMDIRINSRDEIAILGDSINSMTASLAHAAAAALDLSAGKEIQKKFIPLDINKEGNKLSSGYKDTPTAQFFGYYEGAQGVSGDYFDYLDLDGRYYAIIKCDVAGKGIAAAFIMIQVATMFLNYFKEWKPGAQGMMIEKLVYQINDFFETLGFKGRFVAFTLCLFDSEAGVLRFCNAGDNIIHYYDASEGRCKNRVLPETPATGALSNALVKSKGGYEVQGMTFDHGDILLLYTDGIEEAKRKFRNSEFREIVCTEGGEGTPHGNHLAGQGNEEMGPGRVRRIIDAVMNREIYTLHKWHNGEGDKPLHFNFSSCNGSVEEVIMALVAVEKMFRCYKDPGAGEDSRVLADKKINEFLKAHFLEYRDYCADTRESPDNDAYLYYTYLNEDELYDDLTILGMKRK